MWYIGVHSNCGSVYLSLLSSSQRLLPAGKAVVFQLLYVRSVYRFSVDKDHLVVTDVSDDDGGTYTCAANTTLDSVSASAVLRVVGKSKAKHSQVICIRSWRTFQVLNICLLLFQNCKGGCFRRQFPYKYALWQNGGCSYKQHFLRKLRK